MWIGLNGVCMLMCVCEWGCVNADVGVCVYVNGDVWMLMCVYVNVCVCVNADVCGVYVICEWGV